MLMRPLASSQRSPDLLAGPGDHFLA